MLSDYIPINWGLIKSPVNWITILLMVAFGAFALDLIQMYLSNKGNS